ncbi:choloylglycine hydrolase [Enterococcus sp. DIV0840]|uniref:choloylglycine hydrolase family protein n=1 Tax=Enterococcus TaxID=1350 RepID=UPI001A8DD603|nr:MULTISPECIES: choloylglycine hydrolase family protein [Enterococcus]MBO0435802.1 choloylglycine hydrolase family protein [Enterococcus sp. DIV0849a]MBO0474470.1 choloylglycine hydrolase family protein [Enterococcus ureasiticus]
MCTSIFTKTMDGKYLLSRTMDFSFPLDPSPIYMPRNYTWTSQAENVTNENQYGFVGAGRLLGSSYFVADGVNEKGLSIAELYLPGEVQYQKEAEAGKVNLAPHELILLLLGYCATIEEVAQKIETINLVDLKVPMLNIVTPLHWIITDETGRCVIIEPTEKELSIKENPIGVMTNSPCFEWHVQNLRNYLNVRPKQYEPAKFGEFTALPFSQGTGTMGLPGGYTPPERFVRAAFFKEHIDQAQDEAVGVTNNYHILATVRIPKGIVVTDEGTQDYSQYVSTMCNQTRSYYFNHYENNQIAKVTITKELLESDVPIKLAADRNETFKELN